MAAKPRKQAAPAARNKSSANAGNKAVDKRSEKRISMPGVRASHDRRPRFAELLLGISQKCRAWTRSTKC